MYVYVDGFRGDGKVQEVVGLFVGCNQLVVTCHDSLLEIGVSHVAAIDEKILQSIPFARIFRSSYKTVDFYNARFGFDRDQLLLKGTGE